MRKLFTFIFVSALLFSLAAPAYASDSNVTQLEHLTNTIMSNYCKPVRRRSSKKKD